MDQMSIWSTVDRLIDVTCTGLDQRHSPRKIIYRRTLSDGADGLLRKKRPC